MSENSKEGIGVRICITNDGCKVTKDAGDVRMGRESTFFYHVAKLLSKKLGIHFIRKEMDKDGHMVGPKVFYAVDSKRRIGFYFPQYDSFDCAKDFDGGITVELALWKGEGFESVKGSVLGKTFAAPSLRS